MRWAGLRWLVCVNRFSPLALRCSVRSIRLAPRFFGVTPGLAGPASLLWPFDGASVAMSDVGRVATLKRISVLASSSSMSTASTVVDSAAGSTTTSPVGTPTTKRNARGSTSAGGSPPALTPRKVAVVLGDVDSECESEGARKPKFPTGPTAQQLRGDIGSVRQGRKRLVTAAPGSNEDGTASQRRVSIATTTAASGLAGTASTRNKALKPLPTDTPTSAEDTSASGLLSGKTNASLRSARGSSLAVPGSKAKQLGGSPTQRTRQVADGSTTETASPIAPNLAMPGPAVEEDDLDDAYKQRFGARGSVVVGGGLSTLRGVRLDDGTGLDPGYQDMVRNNPLVWADPDFAKTNSIAIWEHYTAHQRPSGKDGARYIDITGLTQLTSDTVDRFLERQRAVIRQTNPKFADQQVDAAVARELPHTVLSGGCRTVAEVKVYLLTYLKKELDRDRDARVGRTDFLMQWKPTVTKLMVLPKPSRDLCAIL